MNTTHTHRQRMNRASHAPVFALAMLALLVTTASPLFLPGNARAQTIVTWNAGSGTDFSWDTTTNWSSLAEPIATDDVYFPRPIPNPGSLLNPELITLTSGELANSLWFASDYTLSGGDLTLSTGVITVNVGNTVTIGSQLLGSAGLTKERDGTLILTNAANAYTGTTTINAGTIVINSQGALGIDPSAVVVTGNQYVGVGGGALVIGSANNNLAGLTFTRGLSLTGAGPTGTGNALNSVGDNTFTGAIVTGSNPTGLNPSGGLAATATGTRLAATFGTTTLNGTLTIDPLGQVTQLGGSGHWVVNSNIVGDGEFQKADYGSMILNGTNTFAGYFQIYRGSVRVSTVEALGGSVEADAISMGYGTLELRSDAGLATNKAVSLAYDGYFYVDHSVGGLALNGHTTFTSLDLNNDNLTVIGRNGHRVTFNDANASIPASDYGTITNGGSIYGTGLLTLAGSILFEAASGDYVAFNTYGDIRLTGSVVQSGTPATPYNYISKNYPGTLTIVGTASTYEGNTNILRGTLEITDFRSINNNTATINLGTGTTGSNYAGTLSVIGNNLSAENVTTAKVVNLNAYTGDGYILANQTGSSPGLLFTSNFTATGTGDKELYLGGTNTKDNEIAGIIPDNGGSNNTAVYKIGPGTWVLSGANTYTRGTAVYGGTLKIRDTWEGAASRNVIVDTPAFTFNAESATQMAGGTLEYVGADGQASSETLGALTPTAGNGTIKITPGAGAGSSASLTFASLATFGAGATLNFIDTGDGVINFTTRDAGYIGGRNFFNGTDFVYNDKSGATWFLRAPVYDSDTGFVSGALGANLHTLLTFNLADAATTQKTLKLDGGADLTLTGGTLTLNNGAGSTGSILVTHGSSTISGGTGISTGGVGQLAIRVNGPGDTLTLDTPLTNGTTGGLIKVGDGKLILNGANAYSVVTTINEGELELGPGSNLGAATNDLVVRQNATLDLGGNSIGADGLDGAGAITNDGAAPILLTLGGNNGGGTFSGTIADGTGGLALTKLGSGTLRLSALNTFSGPVTIGAGVLRVDQMADGGAPSGLGASPAAASNLVFNGGTLEYYGTAAVSTDRLFTLESNGTIQSTNLNYTNAALQFTNTAPVVFGATEGTRTLTLTGTSTGDNAIFLELLNPTGGVLNIAKMDTGQWVLANTANTYTGITSIRDGVLQAVGSTLPANSPLHFNSGAAPAAGILQTSGSFTRALAVTPTAGTGTVTFSAVGGSGFAAADAKLTVNIGGNVTPDTLTWSNTTPDGFISGTGFLVLNSPTALFETEFVNPIDLNGAARTVQVNDNAGTAADFTTLSGVLSGTGSSSGIIKTGAGELYLLGENTYAGDTTVAAGKLSVVTIGNSTSASSNLGAGSGKLVLATTTSSAWLLYGGPGETSNRVIELGGAESGTTDPGPSIIESSGTGPLILTNVTNTSVTTNTGNPKYLYLRGEFNGDNEITSSLGNSTNGGGPFAIIKDDSSTWVLSGNSTYSGVPGSYGTSVSAGALGIRTDSVWSGTAVTSGPIGTGRLDISNASLFGLSGARTLHNDVRIGGADVAAFTGNYSITLLGKLELADAESTTSYDTLTNLLPEGQTLTLSNAAAITTTYTGTGARRFLVNGPGDTIINSAIADGSGPTPIGLFYYGYGTGSLTLGAASTYSGDTTVSGGTLILGTTNAIPSGSNKGNLVINPTTGLSATIDLNGYSQTFNGITATTIGTVLIDNSAAGNATLTIGDNNGAVAYYGGITDSGTGTLSLAKTGSGAAVLALGPFSYSGTTSVTGGSLTLDADVSATTALSVTGNSTLALKGGLSAAPAITAVTVDGGSTLSLFDGAGTPVANLTTLALGAGTGTATLQLNLGDAGSDTLTTANAASAANTIQFDLRDVGMSGGSTYNLLAAPSGGLTSGGATYTLGQWPGGFGAPTLNQSDTLVSVTTGSALTGTLFWNGSGTTQKWNERDGSYNGLNWSTDLAGSSGATGTPGSAITVQFAADTITGGGALVTTLEQDYRVDQLVFAQSTTSADTPVSISIGPGTDSSNRLNIAPGTGTDGIDMQTGGTPAVTISAPLKLGANQTWTVADAVALTGATFTSGSTTIDGASTAGLLVGMPVSGSGIPPGATVASITDADTFEISANTTSAQTGIPLSAASTLTVSGALSGSGALTKTGSGTVIITNPADVTFGAPTVTVSGGILEINDGTALGSSALGNMATVNINSGGTFYSSTPATSYFYNPITLNGGTLSAGGYYQYYSGAINVAANSIIHLADETTSNTVAQRIYLPATAVLTGTGKITVDSVPTVSGGNQVTGLLYMYADNSGWSGGIDLRRGDVRAYGLNALGTGAINVEYGRLYFYLPNGTTYTLPVTNTITVDRAGTSTDTAALDFYVDNSTGSPLAGDPFTVDVTGPVTLGGSGATPSLRIYEYDAGSVASFSGGIVLKADAIIHTLSGISAYTAPTIVINGISESGGSYRLTLNGDTSWSTSTTYQNIQIDVPSTYTGGTTLAAGRLILNHLQGIGTSGDLALNGGYLRLGVDMSGTNAFSRNVTLGGNATLEGDNFELKNTQTLTVNDANRTLTNSLDSGKQLTIAGTVNLSDSDDTAGHTLTFAGAGNTIVSGAIQNGPGGAGNLAYAGSGTLTLSGANTFTGNTTVNNNAGTMTVASTSAIGTGTLAVNAGTLNLNMAAQSVAILNMGGGAPGSSSLLDLGGGTLTLTNSAGGNDIWYSDSNEPLGATVQNGTLDLGGVTRTIRVESSSGIPSTSPELTVSALVQNGRFTKTADGGYLLLTNDGNTFAGPITIGGGTLGFTSIGNVGAGATAMGSPTTVAEGTISLAGTLAFTGSSSQSTDRPITLTASSVLASRGASGTSITYTGAITGASTTLTLTGTDATNLGRISGGLTQTSTSADLTVSSGTWTVDTTPWTIADDVRVVGANAVLNLNTAGVITHTTGTSNYVYIANGGTLNLGADNTIGSSLEGILVGYETAGADATFNLNGWKITTPRLDVGQPGAGYNGIVTGGASSNLLTVGALNLYRGTIDAATNLSVTGTTTKTTFANTVTMAGTFSGSGATALAAGTLVLDYSTNTNSKIASGTLTLGSATLSHPAATLALLGNPTSAITQAVGSLTVAGPGDIDILDVGQPVTLNLGTITRSAAGGTTDFATSTLGVINTTNTATNGILGGWATFDHSDFATVDGSGNIIAASSTANDSVATWSPLDNVTDSTGYTGTTVDCLNINSLRFATGGSAASTVTVGKVLGIESGGILVADTATKVPTITGGELTTNAPGNDLIVQQHSLTTLEIASRIRGIQGFTKAGTGTLVLSGNNDFTGALNVSEGELQLVGGNAAGDTATVNLRAGAALVLPDNTAETIGSLQGGSATEGGRIWLKTGSTLTVNQLTNYAYAGPLAGDSSTTFVKSGLANLQITGPSPEFTGAVLVNQGLLYLSGYGALASVPSFTVNKSGSLMSDQDGTSVGTPNKIGDTAAIILNSADGAFEGATLPRGLGTRTSYTADRLETVGDITFNSGANYAWAESDYTSTGGGTVGFLATNFIRNPGATLDIRGPGLAGSTSTDNTSQFRITDSTNQTAFMNAMIGGGGDAGSATMNIVPWAIGETWTGKTSLGDTHMGDSLVTYISGLGLRPLSFTTEYSTFAASGTTSNVRESLAADLTGIAATQVNAVVINRNLDTAGNTTVTGSTQGLEVTSGALLFTTSATTASRAHTIAFGGFDGGITVGATNEYIVHVVNPSAAATTPTLAVTISSPFTTTAASLVKSGRGTLILTGANSYTGGTTINEGTLEIAGASNIGTGGILFSGGTLKFGGVWDPSAQTVTIGPAGGAFDTNGNNIALASSIGNNGTGALTKSGTGSLTLGAAATYTGGTVITAGSLVYGLDNALAPSGNVSLSGSAILDLAGYDAGAGLVTVAGTAQVSSSSGTGSSTLTTSAGIAAQAGSIPDSVIVAGTGGLLKTTTGTFTIGGANTFSGPVEVQAGILSFNSLGNVGGAASALGTPATAADGTIRVGLGTTAGTLNYTGSGHTSDRAIGLTGTTGGATIDADGSGALVLTGAIGAMNQGAKTLTLSGSSNPSTVLNTISGTVRDCIGTLALTKADANIWVLSGPNSYSGLTTISDGYLAAASNTALGSTAAGTTVTGAAADGALVLANNVTITGETLTIRGRSTAAPSFANYSGTNTWAGNIDFATDASEFNIESMAGTMIITGQISGATTTGARDLNLTGAGDGVISGNIVPGTATVAVEKSGTGTWTLSGTNTYNGVTTVNAGTLVAASNDALGTTTAGTTVTGGAATGTLLLANDITVTGETLSLAGRTTTATGFGNQSGTNTWAGNIEFATGGTEYTIESIAGALDITGAISSGAVTGTVDLNLTGSGDGTVSGAISPGAGAATINVEKGGTGTWTLAMANTYSGTTTITGGTLEAAADNAMGSTSGVTIQNGTLLLSGTGTSRISDTAGLTLDNGRIDAAVTETFGALTLSNSSSIDMGTGASLLTFGDSFAQTWNGILSIYNWSGIPGLGGGGGTDQLYFIDQGAGGFDLTDQQVQFYATSDNSIPLGGPGNNVYLPSGELVPIPEPATGFGALLLAALALVAGRRRAARARP